ncbi:MAG: sulfotransferase [Proteobacteria bacterium]|nr:sulfotransferase [Pseudomonadota bacterium]
MGGSVAAEPVGSIEVALAHAARLLEHQPLLAAEQATEILRVAPGHPQATVILAVARRAAGDAADALALLRPMLRQHARWSDLHYQLGLTLGVLGRGEEAVAALRQATQLSPETPDAWRALADHLAAIGDEPGAEAARARLLKTSTRDPRLMAAGAALCENRIPEAEALLRRHLIEHPTDVAALRMLAEVAGRIGRYRDAESLLERCLALAPGFAGARHNYAVALHRQGKHAEALAQVERLLQAEGHNPNYRTLHAAVLAGIGEYDRAIGIYTEILRSYPRQARIWLSYGHALKTAGQSAEGIRAYRRAIELDPGLGEVWWSLANLKTYRFEPGEMARMRSQLERRDLSSDNRVHLHFALGKALEDAGDYGASFEHYRQGNAIRRGQIPYDAQRLPEHVQNSRAFFTPQRLAATAGQGVAARDPIFIVGLPRAGSTLIEQILSSHSQVEGTMELPDLPALAQSVVARTADPSVRYPEALGRLPEGQLRAMGEEYLARTRIQRKTDKPYFIDKLPNNFMHVGLIHLILPNARIIDARRHPLGCCMSGFKQHFARGQNFTYDLADLGSYYRGYVELMAHFDRVLPGRIHRVIYECLVDDTEAEVRRLLEYCGLPFEPGCLRFYENERAVRTASSEQVRSPIYRGGMDQWRHYEPWLGPLKDALGAVLEAYPRTPDFVDNHHHG